MTWTPILTGIVGSTAHGLATEDSDVDTMTVAVAPTTELAGLYPPTEKKLTRVTTNPDTVTHEVGKFCRLALSCNPSILELLFLPGPLVTFHHPVHQGFGLLGIARHFLSAPAVRDSYLGYAGQQIGRIKRGVNAKGFNSTRAAKHGRHVLRLINAGQELYLTGDLIVKVTPKSLYMDFGDLMARDLQAGIRKAEKHIAAAAEAMDRKRSALPEKPNVTEIRKYLDAVRKEFITPAPKATA